MSKSIVSSSHNPIFNKFLSNLKQSFEKVDEEEINKKNINCFEQFLVIGIDKKDLKNDIFNYEGKILFNYPEKLPNNSWENIISKYIFPFGVNTKLLDNSNNYKEIKE